MIGKLTMTDNVQITVFPHYEVRRGSPSDADGMQVLRDFFPTGQPNYMNFVLFSTDGIHGYRATIEDVERDMRLSDQEIGDPEDRQTHVTYLVVQPRLVALVYGNCRPQCQADIDWLKHLRAESSKTMATLSYPQ